MSRSTNESPEPNTEQPSKALQNVGPLMVWMAVGYMIAKSGYPTIGCTLIGICVLGGKKDKKAVAILALVAFALALLISLT